jgi:hypothetical protein
MSEVETLRRRATAGEKVTANELARAHAADELAELEATAARDRARREQIATTRQGARETARDAGARWKIARPELLALYETARDAVADLAAASRDHDNDLRRIAWELDTADSTARPLPGVHLERFGPASSPSAVVIDGRRTALIDGNALTAEAIWVGLRQAGLSSHDLANAAHAASGSYLGDGVVHAPSVRLRADLDRDTTGPDRDEHHAP